jgi:hypothetical protein
MESARQANGFARIEPGAAIPGREDETQREDMCHPK